MKHRIIGIGKTTIDTNYYWLKYNKEIIKKKINDPTSLSELNKLLENELVKIDDYCKLLNKIITIFK